jgi:hypothetical protein
MENPKLKRRIGIMRGFEEEEKHTYHKIQARE